MTKIIIIMTVIAVFEIAFLLVRNKLFKQIEKSDHGHLLNKKQYSEKPSDIKDMTKWSPIKYVFTRKHKALNDKQLSNLSDLTLVMYLVSWLLMASASVLIYLYKVG